MMLNISTVTPLLEKVSYSSFMLTACRCAHQASSPAADPSLADAAILDADFRFMATSDLTNGLLDPQTESTLNDSYSYKVVEAVLGTLQDKNGEVQNMGVKWQIAPHAIVLTAAFLR